jgi:hypothetical protein
MKFTGTNINIVIDTGLNLEGATELKIVCKKPDYSVVEFTPTATGTKAVYLTSVDDIDIPGLYNFQLYFTLGGDELKSNWVRERFYKPISE